METLARQLLFGVCVIALAVAFADVVHGETAPVVVGLAKCSDCTRKNMNAEAAFKGLLVAVKCKNSKGEYESKAVGQVDKTGAFSVPLAADLVGEDGELKQDCLAQLHSASSAPCPGQEPSKIVAAQPGRDGKKTFVALAGKMHQPSAECASAFLCDPIHKHLHHLIFHKPVVVPPKHDHDHSVLPPVTVPEHKPPSTPVYTPTPTPVYTPKPTPTPTPPKPTPTPTPVTVPEHKPPSTPVYTPTLPKPTPTPTPVTVPEHKPPSTPVYTPTPTPPKPKPTPTPTPVYTPTLPKPTPTPVYTPTPPKPTPIYHPRPSATLSLTHSNSKS